jgi:molybdopterin-guanine dinucleotide biosynthesis protein A
MLIAPAMESEACLAAAILAGGRSERLGGIDKSTLLLGGVPILQRILGAVRSRAGHVFAVGDRHGAAAAAGLEVVEDLTPGVGTLGAIHTAVVRSPCARTLVVGCDMPFVSARLVAHLADVAETTGADVVMPRDDTGYQPLCAVYGRGCAAALYERIARGERHAAVPPGGVRVVEVGRDELAAIDPEGLLFVNVNTPDDYERARRLVEAGRAPV